MQIVHILVISRGLSEGSPCLSEGSRGYGRTVTDERNFSPFYRTSFPTGTIGSFNQSFSSLSVYQRVYLSTCESVRPTSCLSLTQLTEWILEKTHRNTGGWADGAGIMNWWRVWGWRGAVGRGGGLRILDINQGERRLLSSFQSVDLEVLQ